MRKLKPRDLLGWQPLPQSPEVWFVRVRIAIIRSVGNNNKRQDGGALGITGKLASYRQVVRTNRIAKRPPLGTRRNSLSRTCFNKSNTFDYWDIWDYNFVSTRELAMTACLVLSPTANAKRPVMTSDGHPACSSAACATERSMVSVPAEHC